MKFFVGTSGWAYGWNPDGLDWYLKNSGLNSIELNMSFYRFPFPNVIKGWAKKGKELRWSIKVNKYITHIFRFNKKSYSYWKKFKRIFSPMEEIIDFYLFQLPPNIRPESKKLIENFAEMTNLNERFALEVRNREWFTRDNIKWVKEIGLTWVSVDCPDLPNNIVKTSPFIYERIHGRTSWYSYKYNKKELTEIAEKIRKEGARKAYIFFNNNHDMLNNARLMKKIIQ